MAVATPLPTLKVAAVGAALFANQFSSMVVFPFLAFMTADFFPELDSTQLGPYAGLLGSAFHVSSTTHDPSGSYPFSSEVCNCIVAWWARWLHALGVFIR